MEYVLSLSYGKDSLACLGAIEELGLPLNRIITVDIMATSNISADLPEMIEFKKKVDDWILNNYGIAVEHFCSNKTYEEWFYTKYTKGKNKNIIYGHPTVAVNWCNSKLKTSLLKQVQNGADAVYVGIAADESNRLCRLKKPLTAPLAKIGWTEKNAYDWCKERDLLSPIYNHTTRGGCWFCHFQNTSDLRYLRKNYPEYWNILLKWDKDSPRTWGMNRTLQDYDKRFLLEDKQQIPSDRTFRWKMIETKR